MTCDVQWLKLLFEVCKIIFHTFYARNIKSEAICIKLQLEKISSYQRHKNISESVVKKFLELVLLSFNVQESGGMYIKEEIL
jgi:hypothetical protein